jgi:hypothetical protein
VEPKWYDSWNLDKLSKYVVVKPQVNQTEAHFMSHDNITDTYTYLRLCCAEHKRKYWKVVSIEIPRGIWVKMSSGGITGNVMSCSKQLGAHDLLP